MVRSRPQVYDVPTGVARGEYCPEEKVQTKIGHAPVSRTVSISLKDRISGPIEASTLYLCVDKKHTWDALYCATVI